jgi:hypothetical protein
MARTHPHTGATYRVLQRADNSFGAEVSIFGMNPTVITGFATEALAEAWIAKHKQEVADFIPGRGWRGRQPKKKQ